MSGTYVAVHYDDLAKDYLLNWASTNNIPNIIERDEIHTTLVYSRVTLNEFVPEPIKPRTAIIEGLDVFLSGNGNRCLVVKVFSTYLSYRHFWLRELFGATHDFPGYLPHVTLSYDIGDLNIESLTIEPKVLSIIGEIKEPLID